MGIKETLQKLEPIKHRLNEPLLENCNYLINKFDTGDILSEFEAEHIGDLLKVARSK